jgi:hypothetical protein
VNRKYRKQERDENERVLNVGMKRKERKIHRNILGKRH